MRLAALDGRATTDDGFDATAALSKRCRARRCDDLVMSGRDDESFEKKVRAIATELSRSVERAVKSIDLDEVARQVEMGGERFRELADSTGRWISDRLNDPEAHHAAHARDLEPETAAKPCPLLVRIPLMFPVTNRAVRSAPLTRVAGRLSRGPTY